LLNNLNQHRFDEEIKIKQESNSFYNKYDSYLSRYEIDDTTIRNGIETGKTFLENLNQSEMEFKAKLFENNLVKYEASGGRIFLGILSVEQILSTHANLKNLRKIKTNSKVDYALRFQRNKFLISKRLIPHTKNVFNFASSLSSSRFYNVIIIDEEGSEMFESDVTEIKNVYKMYANAFIIDCDLDGNRYFFKLDNELKLVNKSPNLDFYESACNLPNIFTYIRQSCINVYELNNFVQTNSIQIDTIDHDSVRQFEATDSKL
jgi:hypothetical protein